MSGMIVGDGDMVEMMGTKLLRAVGMTLGDYNAYRGWELPAGEDGDRAGYLVEYEPDGSGGNHENHAGYISWSPAEVFEETYRANGFLTFGMAVEMMKRGFRVARAGWNGKGMFLWLLPAATIPVGWLKDEALKAVVDDVFPGAEEVECLGSIRMLTADKKILTGWLASQSDILAEDWSVVGEEGGL